MKKIKPQCMPHNFDFTKAKDLGNFPNFTSAGYMVPCCWLDHTPLKKENFANLWDEELSIKNVNSIEEILYSKQWREFFRTLMNDQENAHPICWKNCSINIDNDD